MPDHIRHTNYECKQCNYFTQLKSDYTKHLYTKKHLKNTTETEKPNFEKKYEDLHHKYTELLEKYTKLLETTHNQS